MPSIQLWTWNCEFLFSIFVSPYVLSEHEKPNEPAVTALELDLYGLRKPEKYISPGEDIL